MLSLPSLTLITSRSFSCRPSLCRDVRAEPPCCEKSPGEFMPVTTGQNSFVAGLAGYPRSNRGMSKAYCRDVINDAVDEPPDQSSALDQSPCHGTGDKGGERPQKERSAPLRRPHDQ